MSKWETVGVAMVTAPVQAARSSREETARVLNSAATSAARAGSESKMAARWTPGREARTRAWLRPMAPVPATPMGKSVMGGV